MSYSLEVNMDRSELFIPTRRLFLASAAFAATMYSVKGAFADELTKTPRQTEGPFYPNKLPLDTDNDLIRINEDITPAVGEITHLTGKVLDVKGNPVRNCVVEIWQCDAKGVYLHTGDSDKKKAQQDAHFQGFGRFATSSKGEYYFRTIKPVPYPGRTPHIHVKVKKNGKELLCTQCYIAGHPGNPKDGVYQGIKDAKQRDNVTIDFAKLKDSKLGELTANFDIILGATPELD
ncbi:MAG: protocatechuate 3,4-dioxygenase [Gemmataceae bacterium]